MLQRGPAFADRGTSHHQPDFRGWRTIAKQAQRPPLGWNSWDVYGTNVTEAEVLAQAKAMATRLKGSGYDTVVIDMAWYAPGTSCIGHKYREPNPHQLIDAYGRLIPCPERFPSSAGGKGFAPLAAEIHKLGLKFGIHVLRGIAIQAVECNTPILGTELHARDIMTYEDRCVFYDGHYAVDCSRPGSLAYYQSLLQLYAEWGVDFIKADDMISWPQHYDEVYAFRWALDHCGRPMVFSLSPGSAGYMERSYVNHCSDMFRISGDLWDGWDTLKAMFATCRSWKGHTGPGRWADCDMIPIGIINVRGEAGVGERRDRFTATERRTLMTLWSMFRSPLMLGCDLTRLDDETIGLFTHPELMRIDQHSIGNDEISQGPSHSVWSARDPERGVRWIAAFNLADHAQAIEVDLCARGEGVPAAAQEIWSGRAIAVAGRSMPLEVEPHGVQLLLLRGP